MSQRNKSVTELIEDENIQVARAWHQNWQCEQILRTNSEWSDKAKRISAVNDPRYRDAQRWRNYWISRQMEVQMQDEGDLHVRPKMSWRLLGWATLAAVVIYSGIVAALILIGK